MTLYSQRDVKWKGYLGNSKTDFNNYGCKCTSFAIIDGRTPREMNDLFVAKGAFSGDLLLSDQKCADALGWTFLGVKSKPEGNSVIIEVDMSPSPGKQQHFVVHDGAAIIDPWTGTRRDNSTYPIINYRCFNKPLTEESMEMTKDLKEAVELLGVKAGEKLNDKEQDRLAGEIRQMKLTNVRLLANNEELAKKLTDQEKVLKEYIAQAGTCEPELATCKDNLRIQTDKANAIKNALTLGDVVEILWGKIRGIKIEK